MSTEKKKYAKSAKHETHQIFFVFPTPVPVKELTNFLPDGTAGLHRQSRRFMPPRVEREVWEKVAGVF